MNKVPGYWQETRRLTLNLLVAWLLITFGLNWFAAELNEFTFLGFPFGFYMAAQGELIMYLFIIWYYNRRMNALDSRFEINDE